MRSTEKVAFHSARAGLLLPARWRRMCRMDLKREGAAKHPGNLHGVSLDASIVQSSFAQPLGPTVPAYV